MVTRPAWYNYAAEVSAKIDRLPRNSMEGQRRFQFVLHSHITAITEHDYPGTFGDWEYLLETVSEEAKVR